MDESDALAARLRESESLAKDLQKNIEDLTDFIEKGSVPLHMVNGSGIIIWANKAELDLLGYSEAEYVGKHISNFHVDKNVIEDILTRLIKKETLRNYYANLRCKNGEIKQVIINSNVRWEGEKFVYTRCFTRDITDLKRAEQQRIELINELQETNSALKTENEQLKMKLKKIGLQG